tara:strand:+ start:23385 stop:24281 length:897 start_codon:yes stop_codon:yes gene_type:complete
MYNLKKNNFIVFLFHGVIKKNRYKVRNYNSKHILENRFYKFLKNIKKKGNIFSLKEIYSLVKNNENIPRNCYSITFDDGFENNYSIAAPILSDLNIPSTFFFSTDFIDKNHMSWIDKIEYCLEYTKSGAVYLPKSNKKYYFFNIKSKIELLNIIRKNIKNNLDININEFVKIFFDQLNFKYVDRLNTEIDKKINWKKVKLLNNCNLFDIGGHSNRHLSLTSLSINDAKSEIQTSINLFKKKAKIILDTYSYPEGQKIDYNKAIIKILKKKGIKICPSAIEGVNNKETDFFNLKRIQIS